jgi:hypothetical protein
MNEQCKPIRYAGAMDAQWRTPRPLHSVTEGQEVWAGAPPKFEKAVRCRVIVSAGYHAKVRALDDSFERWFNISDLNGVAEQGSHDSA